MTEHVNADELRVTVEMGDDYRPSDRLAAALSELQSALTEGEDEDEDEVAGFGWDPVRSFTYTSVLGGAMPTGLQAFPKVETQWIDKSSTKVFKF